MSTGSSHSTSFGSGAGRMRPSCEPMTPGTMKTRGASGGTGTFWASRASAESTAYSPSPK
jgi:hypothetical protein